MIISPGRGYIFVHIPKTGGTSLALALESRAMKQDILIGDTPKAKRRRKRLKGVETAGRLWKHSTLRDIHGLVEDAEIERFFTFTIVRNPWDRMVSYYHWLRVQTFGHPAVSLAHATDFPAFLNHHSTRRAFLDNPYAAYVTDRHGVERCDLFLRLESLQHDIAALESRLNLKLPPLGHANTSARRRDWRSYYSETDRSLLGDICAVDIDRFGFRFDP